MLVNSLPLVVLAALVVAAPAQARKEPADQRAAIRSMAESTLKDLYAAQPAARKIVEGAAGYAVFSNFSVKILVAGSGSGKGIAVNSASKAETFMKMVQVQAGLGVSVMKFRCVFVFATEKDVADFVDKGWQGSGQSTAAAKAGDGGAAPPRAASPSRTASGCSSSRTRDSRSRRRSARRSSTRTVT